MRKFHRAMVTIGAISAALAVIAGAFGAHTLRDILPPDRMSVFNTAVEYHFYHSLGLFAVAWTYTRWRSRYSKISGWSMFTGIILFSGSLYLLAFTGISWLGAITPFGGVAFIVGWIALAMAPKKRGRRE
ncbi:MAG: DUF423 domain-containing protein [Candidatus Marinimicrobia bacterium]|nr:DUF423 domain-containing protein [Candidatus Neomarinimicrobiota bacterium]MCF7829061.1 DUF423 domain-containing protein [Candidatus Neomarinimicrobiota bacterium]MCF7881802.1 DUF423 domain-containing protein [Candidatus Neomarinimicrobiota bacterium]